MSSIWQAIVRGYLKIIEPAADLLVRLRVSPNLLTTIGTLCSVAGGIAFAFGRIHLGGWIIGLCAIFDVLDGVVARRTQRTTVFGAFYDSTLDRLADGAVLGGLLYFFATDPVHRNKAIVLAAILGMIGMYLTSYTRARAEALGIDAKVGMMQRPERVALISAPQAFFGLALNGYVLMAIVCILGITAWITAIQRILFVRRATETQEQTRIRIIGGSKKLSARFASRRAQS
ncbi:MAG TPA: CDP-alcohol phosphatidyltransferase family protein [Gemmatimonadaceae bacterium]|jgi:CDP-diacylglycerol--glycerol-3-phosphate 3-phosphatidyltransferase|nr:CDP-alcohol phosphatidyltransferase family protein [Gemmatimonadaceae bacterium]